ncbi:hypothetical protein L1987_66806 [Smallanthus sonchifolius]|uniref:Uncharacterized protein n=1 Tax=Smallanthus sonchifolius TaxID=185202 RepID=A0ACB9BYI9_9ASTR|nr:hypothetical protein L1987_66806 [Smallanthus sonchifolius]
MMLSLLSILLFLQNKGQVLKAGVDNLTITWAFNPNLTISDSNYTTVEAKLCYAPVSQTGRDDRKTDDNLDFDKTCPIDITDAPYKRSNNTFTWAIPKNTTSATYFVRVYAVKANKHETAYGQTTDANKTTNLFQIDGVVSVQKDSAAWPVIGNSFGYGYALLLMLILILFKKVNSSSSSSMEVPAGFLVFSLLLSCFVATSYGVYFSSLKETLMLTASPKTGQVLKAGEDKITVTWRFNRTLPAGTDAAYKTIKVKLCYAPISQKDRSWRKTVDLLKKDKTCPHKIVARPYAASNNSFTWTVERDIPSGVYFVRAFAFNAQEEQVAYGQTTDAHKSTNLFEIQAITGRHVSLDIASICFSAFSIVSLAGFFYMEKRKGKTSK